jgi:predicted amidohydrolase YtcJ
MQGIHMSSDRPWAIDRLGAERIASGAYMWKSLIESGAVLVNGTDVPVEPVNPFASYYALVTRMTLAGYPEGGFEPSERLNRETALKTYTINPAFGAFEEALKGSLEPGKVADFIVLDRDLMTVAPADIADTKVLMTVMNGAMIYKADSAMFQPEAQ